MNSNENILCEDWGWYIDLETMKHVSIVTHKINNKLLQNSKFTRHLNINLYKINESIKEEDEEDEYEYYFKNQIDLENCENINNNKNMPTYEICDIHVICHNSNKLSSYISTTIISIFITYFVFFVI
jgi:hypothetical protein